MPPLKISRDLSTKLIKYVQKVDIKFNPFDSRTRSARELLRQVQSERLTKSNPKIKITRKVLSTVDPPEVKFLFVDGTEKVFDSQRFVAKEMMDEIYLFANNLDIEYELSGKSIDDK